MSAFTVAWMDQGDRVGLCPRCIPGAVARNAAICDLTPVDAKQAAGKGCAECGEPLAARPGYGAHAMLESEGRHA